MGRRQRNNGLTMTAFHSRQSDCGRRVQKITNASAFDFTPQIAPSNLHGHVHEGRKIQCNNVSSTVQKHGCKYCFYEKQALPLVWTRFFRIANSSPMAARSPARRPHDGREVSGKTSSEITRVMAAQLPGNSRATANAMPPDDRADNLRDNLPCAGIGRAMAALKLVRQLAT